MERQCCRYGFPSMNRWTLSAAFVWATWAVPVGADWTEARCDVYPRGQDHGSTMIPCTFGQRQGYVTITREDGVTHDLSPTGDAPGNFRDQQGRPVYRESGLGDQGLIFRFPDESVYVYWNRAGLAPGTGAEKATAPFSTDRYDATTLLRCKAVGDAEFGNTCLFDQHANELGIAATEPEVAFVIHDPALADA